MNRAIINRGKVMLERDNSFNPLKYLYNGRFFVKNVLPGNWLFYESNNMILANNKDYNIKTYGTLHYKPGKFFCDKIWMRFNYNKNENKDIYLYHNDNDYYEISYGIYHDNLLSHIKIVRKTEDNNKALDEFDYKFVF